MFFLKKMTQKQNTHQCRHLLALFKGINILFAYWTLYNFYCVQIGKNQVSSALDHLFRPIFPQKVGRIFNFDER